MQLGHVGANMLGWWWVRRYGLQGPAAAASAAASSASTGSPTHPAAAAVPTAAGVGRGARAAAHPSAVGPAEHTLLEVVEAEQQQQQQQQQQEQEQAGGDHVLRCPVVLVEGFLGGGSAWYWNQCIRQDKVIFAKLGPVSSLHDRACELFYQLKGGTVDYGAEHAASVGHGRYGQTYAGEHPNWSRHNPVHLFGHSLGGCTIRYLHHLLKQRFFPSHDTSADWVLSITTLSAPHLGTTTAYILGECEASPPDVHWWSVGSFLTRAIHVHEWLAVTPRELVDLNLQHWRISWRDLGVRGLARVLLWRSPISQSIDNAAYDSTVFAMERHNRELETHDPTTYYRSYVTRCTEVDTASPHGFHRPRPAMPVLLRPIARLIGQYRPSKAEQLAPWFNPHDWWENDGVVSSISQRHPFLCGHGPCEHYVVPSSGIGAVRVAAAGTTDPAPGNVDCLDRVQPGVWQVLDMPDFGHTDVLPFPQSPTFLQNLFRSYVDYLERIEDHRLGSPTTDPPTCP